MLSDDELKITRDIQEATDKTTRTESDPESAAFLKYLKGEFLTQAEMVFSDLSTVWLENEDEGPCSADSSNCRRLRIGTDARPNEHRTHRHDRFDVRVETRQVRGAAYVEFTSPGIDDIWEDIKACAMGAAIAAVVSAIIVSDFTTARTVFYPAFYACLVEKIGDRAKEVELEFFTDNEYSCWKYHCN
ncbi:hypothetical protein [Bacillus toyonensis]|uniref:hypothetical protein n=1 Tax=Bacillus toyonensis TaxID=155322 RepID=UPI00259D8013|nr:hypothetical protein [Bacillus toyonensis]MDM5254226.1 hypothetical protein [Bacillus toyonensis]